MEYFDVEELDLDPSFAILIAQTNTILGENIRQYLYGAYLGHQQVVESSDFELMDYEIFSLHIVHEVWGPAPTVH